MEDQHVDDNIRHSASTAEHRDTGETHRDERRRATAPSQHDHVTQQIISPRIERPCSNSIGMHATMADQPAGRRGGRHPSRRPRCCGPLPASVSAKPHGERHEADEQQRHHRFRLGQPTLRDPEHGLKRLLGSPAGSAPGPTEHPGPRTGVRGHGRGRKRRRAGGGPRAPLGPSPHGDRRLRQADHGSAVTVSSRAASAGSTQQTAGLGRPAHRGGLGRQRRLAHQPDSEHRAGRPSPPTRRCPCGRTGADGQQPSNIDQPRCRRPGQKTGSPRPTQPGSRPGCH